MQKKLEDAIKSYVILMDTCFAMKDEFESFIIRYRSDLVENPIKVPSVVISELQHRSKHPFPKKPEAQMQAKRALKLIEQ